MNHLPECQDALIPDFENERWICICDRLRACEQRVLNLNPIAIGVLIAQRSRERALDAAREAAEVALLGTLQLTSDRVLAAIDALREKP